MDLVQVIKDNCNPVNINDLIKIVNIFEDLNYDKYMDDMYNSVEEAMENDSNNVGRFVSNILMNHAQEVLLELGITMSNEIEDLTIHEVFQILNFQMLIEYSDTEKAKLILSTIDAYEDMLESYSFIISQFTNLTYTRVYNVIDNVSLLYINKLTEIMSKITDEESDDSINYLLVNVIKEIRPLATSELIGLRLIRNDFDSDAKLVQYLSIAQDRIDNGVMEETAANFMSLLILGSDSRFNRLEYFVNMCEDLIDDEAFKASVYNRIKTLDSKVEGLYFSYGIKEDVING